MNMMKLMILILPVSLLAGCCSSHLYGRYDSDPVELARVEDGESGVEIYELRHGDDYDDVTLVVRSETEKSRASFGLGLLEIDKDLAQKKGMVPFKGLYIKTVSDASPAAKAGIMPGDILIRMNDVELIYMDQYNHMIRNSIPPDREVELVVLRGFENRVQLSFNLIPEWSKVVLPSTRAIALESHKEKGPAYVGINTGTLPAEWTEKIYGDSRSTVMISRVVVGSPGYKAGLRCGDRILSVNGQYFETAALLYDWIQDHGPNGETVVFELSRLDEGIFKTEVDLEDYDGDVRIYFPFLFDMDHDVKETEWEFGPLGLVIDYEGYYRKRYSREVNYRRSLSCLIGLYKYEWTPSSSRTRLLWFIDFDSDR